MKKSLAEAKFFKGDSFKLHTFFHPKNNEGLGFTAAMVEMQGVSPTLKIGEDTTKCFLVLEGNGDFVINGEKTEVQKDDLIVVKPGDTYDCSGSTLKLFEFAVSPSNTFSFEEVKSS